MSVAYLSFYHWIFVLAFSDDRAGISLCKSSPRFRHDWKVARPSICAIHLQKDTIGSVNRQPKIR